MELEAVQNICGTFIKLVGTAQKTLIENLIKNPTILVIGRNWYRKTRI